MIIRNIKQTLLYIIKHKLDSTINILGLTIGITAFIILLNYINFEYSFDKCYPNHSNIYRIVTDVPQQNGNIMNTAMSSGYFSRLADDHFDEIIASTHMTPSFNNLISIHHKPSFEDNFWFADSSFFKVFNFPLKQGNPMDVLDGSFKIVISERIAEKYFGNKNPVHKTIRIFNQWDYTVSGVLKDLPSNIHFDIDFLATPDSIGGFHRNNWGSLGLFNYVLLKDGTKQEQMEEAFHQFSIDRMGEAWANTLQFKLQATEDIHLKSDRLHEVGKTSNSQQLKYLVGIALLILLMAGLNFMNLYSSRAEYRSKEVGLKKVIGAQRSSLIVQFLTESIFYTFIAILISLVIIYYSWNYLEVFLHTKIPFQANRIFYILIGILLFTGIISGLYPAIYLSSFKPIYAIKAMFRNKKNGSALRKALVITQFTLALFMIVATLVVYIQMQFIRNKDLGFDYNNLLTLRLQTENLYSRNEMLREEFTNIQGVSDICFSSARIDNILAGQRPYILQDSISTDNKMDYMIRTITVDENFIPMYKIKLLEGRNFSMNYSTDDDEAIIANESAIKLLGLKNPIGKKLISYRQDSNYVYTIVGVMKDFNYQSLHAPIEPLLFLYSIENFPIMTLKTSNTNLSKLVRTCENKMAELSPDFPISANILSEHIREHYEKEERISTIYQFLAFLSIFIACLGLFGIVSFILEKKTKATGIRKVLGASDLSLFMSLSKDLMIWLCVAALVSFPLSYFVMNKWLQGFAYKANIYWWIYPLAFILLFSISFLTVTYKTIKTIRVNPSESLRYE